MRVPPILRLPLVALSILYVNVISVDRLWLEIISQISFVSFVSPYLLAKHRPCTQRQLIWRLLSVRDGMMVITRTVFGMSPTSCHVSGSLLSHCKMKIALEVFSGSRKFASLERRQCGIRKRALDLESDDLFELLQCPFIESLSVPLFLYL